MSLRGKLGKASEMPSLQAWLLAYGFTYYALIMLSATFGETLLLFFLTGITLGRPNLSQSIFSGRKGEFSKIEPKMNISLGVDRSSRCHSGNFPCVLRSAMSDFT